MENLYDDFFRSAFDRVATTMGYTATWVPSEGGGEQTTTVLFKDDTGDYELQGNVYDAVMARMEYRSNLFAGLKPAVDAGLKEMVNISFNEGSKQYWVLRIDTKFDGRDCVAYLVEVGYEGADFNQDFSWDFNRVP